MHGKPSSSQIRVRHLQNRTCLSFKPSSNISSISVNLGCLLLSSLSLISLGSKAILWPFSSLLYEVSGDRSLKEGVDFGAGDATLLEAFSSPSVAAWAAPLRRVRPPGEAMRRVVLCQSGASRD